VNDDAVRTGALPTSDMSGIGRYRFILSRGEVEESWRRFAAMEREPAGDAAGTTNAKAPSPSERLSERLDPGTHLKKPGRDHPAAANQDLGMPPGKAATFA
jgi:hypothetical protein